jgi:actin-like ATPase involved in cell morphogenesis
MGITTEITLTDDNIIDALTGLARNIARNIECEMRRYDPKCDPDVGSNTLTLANLYDHFNELTQVNSVLEYLGGEIVRPWETKEDA